MIQIAPGCIVCPPCQMDRPKKGPCIPVPTVTESRTKHTAQTAHVHNKATLRTGSCGRRPDLARRREDRKINQSSWEEAPGVRGRLQGKEAALPPQREAARRRNNGHANRSGAAWPPF